MKGPAVTLVQLREQLPLLAGEALIWYCASIQTGYHNNSGPANACNAMAVELYLRALQIASDKVPIGKPDHNSYAHFMNLPPQVRDTAAQKYAALQGPNGIPLELYLKENGRRFNQFRYLYQKAIRLGPAGGELTPGSNFTDLWNVTKALHATLIERAPRLRVHGDEVMAMSLQEQAKLFSLSLASLSKRL